MYSVEQLRKLYLDYMYQNPFTKSPTTLYEPVDYIMQLGGKRMRPVMTLLAYNLFKSDVEAALPVAQAVEVFHNFSLVHDDIMDEAPLRRGQPTVHQKYGINTGILSGDVMLVHAYQYLLKVADKALIPALVEEFSKVAEAVCIGQQYDMNFEQEETVAIEEYIKMIEHKTAFLLLGALKMGAMVAKASAEDVLHLGEFGRNVGIAFQLQDDVLDSFCDPKTFGKKVGGDIVQNKKTFLVLKTLEVASEKDQCALKELMKKTTQNEAEKIAEVKAIFTRNNIQDLANLEKEDYQNKAIWHLKQIGISAERKAELSNLATSLLNRKI